MDLSELQKLHSPCEGDLPSGANLEYQDLFLQMMRLSEKHPEVQYGSTIVPEQEPDWERLLESCLEVAQQTRDLRVGVLLVDSLCRTHSWAGLSSGLELLEGWMGNFWPSIHPQLDPTENHDPTTRLSILSHLIADDQLLASVQRCTLAENRFHGDITLKDYIAAVHPSSASKARLNLTDVEAILKQTDSQLVQQVLTDIQRSQRAFEGIDRILLKEVGTDRWSGEPLLTLLSRAEQAMLTTVPAMPEHQACELPLDDVVTATVDCQANTAPEIVVAAQTSQSLVEPTASRTHTKIMSRSDATIAIDSICSYFEQNEPASPVPLLLQRAKRLIPMSFIEILRELAPNEGQQLLQTLSFGEKPER